ncbi:MAG: hypothetical protein IKE03_01375 [Blautia sp.]|nr:hypothetical protein [Blautia sp.]
MPPGRLTANIPLKIGSLIVGFLIWLIVINVDNPKDTRIFVIQGESVEMLNKAYIDSYNKMCLQDDKQTPIRVTVTAERKTLKKLSASDILAVADLQQAVSLETDPVMVPVTVTVANVAPNNIKVSPQFIGVHLEDKVTQEYVVNASYGESRPARGTEVGSQTVSPEKVKITGPRSLINKIDKVTASVNVSGLTKDSVQEATLSITDRNQDVLSEGRMSYLTIDNGGKVNVTTDLWRVQSGIRLYVAYTGEPADGYRVETVSTVPETISLAGTDQALEALRTDSNTIWLIDETLDISGYASDFEQKVSLTDYLPQDTRLTTGSSEDVYVNIMILPRSAHAYSLAAGEIHILGLGENLQASFESDSVLLRIMANGDKDINNFAVDRVRASVDLTGLTAGSREVPVNLDLPKGYELLENVTAMVSISEITNVDQASGAVS